MDSPSSPYIPATNTQSSFATEAQNQNRNSNTHATAPRDTLMNDFWNNEQIAPTQEDTMRVLLPPTPKSPRAIHDALRAKLASTLASNDSRGVIYILRHPSHPWLGLKIGSTSRLEPSKRFAEHARNCKLTPHIVYEASREVDHCLRVEALVHADLAEYSRDWRCGAHPKPGGSKHTEYFQVEEDVARRAVRRWEEFMQRERPYAWYGGLSVVWTHVLRHRELRVDEEGELTFEARRAQCDAFFKSPTGREYVDAYVALGRRVACYIYSSLRKGFLYVRSFFWQLVTLSYGMTMLVVCRNTMALMAFAIVLVCAGCSKRPALKNRSPRKPLGKLS